MMPEEMGKEKKKNKNTAAKLRANNKYAAANYDEIKFRVKKGEKEKLMQYAREHGYSLNALIYDAVARFRKILDEAIADSAVSEASSDAVEHTTLNLGNSGAPSVVSLYSGMGSVCLAFAQAGFDIVKAYEEDHTACEAFRYLFGSERLVEGDMSCVNTEDIPRADVLVSGFPPIFVPVGEDYFNVFNHYEYIVSRVLHIVEKVHPSVFYLELDDAEPVDFIDPSLSEETKNDIMAAADTKEYIYTLIKERLCDMQYHVQEYSFKAYEFTGLPQSGKKKYLIASVDDRKLRSVMSSEVDRVKPRPAVELIRRDQKQDNFFYYQNDVSFDRYVINSVKSRSNLYLVDISTVYDCPDGMCPALDDSMVNKRNTVALLDDFGVRQLTPGEFLMFKGYPEGIVFPKEVSVEDRYRLAGASATIPVTRRCAEYIRENLESADEHTRI